MPEATPSTAPETNSPNYVGLVRFLIEPFLENPDTLYVNCEQANRSQRVWLRVAFEEQERGRVWGRGGRNIQAIRTAIEAAARGAGQSVYLDVYGSHNDRKRRDGESGDRSRSRKSRPQRSAPAKPALRSRSR